MEIINAVSMSGAIVDLHQDVQDMMTEIVIVIVVIVAIVIVDIVAIVIVAMAVIVIVVAMGTEIEDMTEEVEKDLESPEADHAMVIEDVMTFVVPDEKFQKEIIKFK